MKQPYRYLYYAADWFMVSATLIMLKPHYGAWAFAAAMAVGLYGYINFVQGTKAWMYRT